MFIEVDTPACYRPTRTPHLPGRVSTPEEFDWARHQSESCGFVPPDTFEAILAQEETLLGLEQNDPRFLSRRVAFYETSQASVSATFAQLQPSLQRLLSRYMAPLTGLSPTELQATFEQRVDPELSMLVLEPLVFGAPDEAATYNADQGIVHMPGTLLLDITSGKKPFADYFVRTVLAHEAIHGFLTSARQHEAFQPTADPSLASDAIVRNGLHTLHTPEDGPAQHKDHLANHLLMVNEAYVEHVRQRLYTTAAGAYPLSLAVLRTCMSFEPTLEATLASCAVTTQNSLPVTNRLEAIVGPLGLEYISESIAALPEPWKHPLEADALIADVSSCFDNPRRAQEVLSAQWAITQQHVLNQN